MYLTDQTYVPGLKWRLGEYQALLRLSEDAKDRVVPYITIPRIEFDFATNQMKKSVHEHVHPFVARYKAKWGKRPAWIAAHKSIATGKMDDGSDVYSYVFEGLREFGANAVPAVPLDVDEKIIASTAAIVARDNQGVAVIVRLEDLMKKDPAQRITLLLKALNTDAVDTDLIVDLDAPNYEPYQAFSGALVAAFQKLGNLHRFRNFVLIGTAIPETMADVSKPGDNLPRHDWLFYRTLVQKLPETVRRPAFGDYTIVHPSFSASFDMRKIKPAGKLIYTTENGWCVRKGGAFRDNSEQMHEHCADIASLSDFKGANYCYGDDYISKCAARKVGPSNLTRWKDVAINHHITHVVDDLSTLGGRS